MKTVASLLFLVLFFNVCERPPVQKDIAGNHSTPVPGKIWRNTLENSPGSADAPYELQFLDTMTAYNEQAIEMAQLVATRAQHNEMKSLSNLIFASSREEISQMKALRTKWFAEARPAINANLPGVSDAANNTDIGKLDSLKENAFDLEFLRQMTSHRENSIRLANDLLSRDTNAELKSIAQAIIKGRENEILQMKAFQSEWTK